MKTWLALATLLVGCAAPQRSVVARGSTAPSAPAARVEPAKAAAAGPRLKVRIASDEQAEQRIHVRLELEGLAPTTLLFAPLHPALIGGLAAQDDRGPLAVSQTPDRIELGRAPIGRAVVTYDVELKDGPSKDGFEPSAEPIDLRVLGRDVLALPEIEERVPIAIELRTGALKTGGASSFGLGVDQSTTARIAELREAYFLAGPVETAEFHVSDGDDIAGWLGFTAFDPRWVSASMAGARSAIDAWMGRQAPAGTAHALLFQSSNAKRGSKIVVRAAPRGAVVSVDPRAPWTAVGRILVAQAFVQRYVGGFLWVGDRSDAASGVFWAAGFSRAIATEILANIGLLDRGEYAAELSSLIAETVFPSEGDPARLALARGALVALSLDTSLRAASAGKQSLRSFVRELLTEAANARRDTIPRADFFARLRERAGDTGGKLEAALEKGEADLPSDLLAPCYRLVRRDLTQFELGFIASADQRMKVLSVKPGSRAAAAGLREGDVIEDLRYEDGRPNTPVTLTLVRDEKKTKVRFLPAGATRPGRAFDRVAGVPDRSC